MDFTICLLESVRQEESFEWARQTRRTERGNQVGLFLLKSRLYELIRSQTTHH